MKACNAEALSLAMVLVAVSGTLILVPGTLGQETVTATANQAICGQFGAILRDQRCIYPALADCRLKPSNSAIAALFQCPNDTFCEPITGLCVCQGEYKNTGDDSGVLTCIRGQSHGQLCNHSTPCLDKFECSNFTGGVGVCNCRPPGHWNATEGDGECVSDSYCKSKNRGSFYDQSTRKCKCLLQSTSCSGISERGAQAFDCPTNSTPRYQSSTGRHRCECNSEFVRSSSKMSCLPKLGHGEECTAGDADACDTSKHLSCRGGKCDCDPASRSWYAGQGTRRRDQECKLKAGNNCDSNRDCLENAKCENRGIGFTPNHLCTCESGFSQIDGFCQGRHRSVCTRNEGCMNGLDCIEGVCDCRNQISTVYESGSGGCKIIIVSPCSNGNSNSTSTSTCVANAECNPTAGFCECKPGFRLDPNTRGLCMAAFGYGDSCTKSGCDFDRGYTCHSGKCACADSFLIYRGPQKGCVAPIGSVCGSQNVGSITYKISCEGGGECRSVSEGRFICVEK